MYDKNDGDYIRKVKEREREREKSNPPERGVTEPIPRKGMIATKGYIKVHRNSKEDSEDGTVCILGYGESVTVTKEENEHLYIPRLNGYIRKEHFKEFV